MDQSRFQFLLKNYLENVISDAELIELTEVLMLESDREKAISAFDRLISEEAPATIYHAQNWDHIYQKIISETKPVVELNGKKRGIINWKKWVAAASIFGIITYGLWFVTERNKTSDSSIAAIPVTMDIAPGKEGAILTLADGTQLILDSLGNGVIADENGTHVVLKDGHISYDGSEMIGNTSADTYNTMTTPKGRQFKVVLPDGTKVWLNAESSLRYPTRFSGNKRVVEIAGEAYFEVARNEKLPFKVKVSNQAEIEVLGTHFNVNAYENEMSTYTTLVEGSVKVKPLAANHPWSVLTPGQQARVNGTIQVINDVEIEKVMAWKNGLFNFNDAGLEEVMRQLSRWYDIEVVFENEVPDLKFGGKMSRNVPLSDVLKGLEDLNVHFVIKDGNKLVVMP